MAERAQQLATGTLSAERSGFCRGGVPHRVVHRLRAASVGYARELPVEHLAALAVALGARTIAGWSSEEDALTRDLPPVAQDVVSAVSRDIKRGRDPLGNTFDVNYGRVLRDLFTGPLGGRSVTVIEPTAEPFPDAATTATITCFQAGSRTKLVRLKRVASLEELKGLEEGRTVRRQRLEAAHRWTPLTRSSRNEPAGYVELGELCRVHRGQVTGANKVWIAGGHSAGLPAHLLFASVTRARELFSAGRALTDPEPLKKVIDLPVDLDGLDSATRRAVEAFLEVARSMGAAHGYIARNRKAW